MNPGRHPVLRLLSRFGNAARGAIFGLVGLLAAEAAIRLRGRASGAIDALRDALRRPHGRAVVAAIAAGLFADAVFRLAQAIFLRSRGPIRRISYAVRGAAALAFGIVVVRMLGERGTPRREGALLRTWAARLLSHDAGQKVLLAAGILLVLAGARECLLAAVRRGKRAGPAARRLSRIGLAAHGLILAVVGIFAARAAIDVNPAELVETGGALRALGRLPYGAAWLGAVAAGLMAYGLSLFFAEPER